MLNGIVHNGFSKNLNVKILPYGGATSEDMIIISSDVAPPIDHIKSSIRIKSEQIIIHVGTNDMTQNINTIFLYNIVSSHFSIYKPPSQCLNYFTNALSSLIDFFTGTYENILVMGDFNADPQNPTIKRFIENYGLYNLIKTKTCWKSASGICIDLILTNQKHSFKNSGAAETALSDHHSLIYTMLKTSYTKLEPTKQYYRSYTFFNNESFLYDLNQNLQSNNLTCRDFETIFMHTLDEYAPLKTRYLRANKKPYMNKNLKIAIMHRSKLKNIANKTNRPEDMANYKAQRNLVVNMNRKTKKDFFNNTNIKEKPKSFWNACKPFFSEKSVGAGEKILLVEHDKIVSNNQDIATIFNKYFSNIINTLQICKWNSGFTPYTCGRVLNAIDKFKNHPSIINIKSQNDNTGFFVFSHVYFADTFHEILHLDSRKKTSGVIPIKILRLAA